MAWAIFSQTYPVTLDGFHPAVVVEFDSAEIQTVPRNNG
jgi:hypothetical protein